MNFGLMVEFVITGLVSLVIVWGSEIILWAEQQASCRVSLSFLHFGIIKRPQSQLDIALLISCIVLLIVVLFFMFELWIPPESQNKITLIFVYRQRSWLWDAQSNRSFL
jgi:hypothetical protein